MRPIALQRQRELEQLGHRVVVADAARDLVAELRRQAPERELEPCVVAERLSAARVTPAPGASLMLAG